ncbi:Lrp/AsnC family transcriptional regulator [Betaproteobacteria bacterium SCN2]|jgi:DNA-binding Lrp family transcriptional regulator|nr:Lrp/AsnC family transcriptional regulator [Betaproteobacteria bacterium SCN2]
MDTALSDLEFHLLNDWQRDLPLSERPYAAMAEKLGCTEAEVIAGLGDLMARGHISRVGAVFRPHVLGWSTLAAVSVPESRIESVAQSIDAYPEVNHNYEREHAYNLWFVVTAPTEARVAEVLAGIHRQTGCKPLNLPMLADYHIDLGFDLARGTQTSRPHLSPAGRPQTADSLRRQLEPSDYALAAALEGGLALVHRPYAELAAKADMSEVEARQRLERLVALGIIRRLGVVVRHRELGYTANAMVVWDVADERVEELGRQLGAQPSVTLCYRRPRVLPEWPYNLFSMVHGRSRQAVLAEIERLRAELGLQDIACHPLFSLRRFKQCGARYAGFARAA